MTEESFVFWGPFVGFAALTALYLVWMWWVERREGE